MDISVRAYGDLREIVGSETTLTLATGATVGDALAELDISAEDVAMAMVNGKHVQLLDGFETALEAGDDLSVSSTVVAE